MNKNSENENLTAEIIGQYKNAGNIDRINTNIHILPLFRDRRRIFRARKKDTNETERENNNP